MTTRLQSTPHNDVFVYQPAVLLAASYRPKLVVKFLPFASSYHLIAVLIAKNGGLPTEDFHLISSCPCWAYTSRSTGLVSLAGEFCDAFGTMGVDVVSQVCVLESERRYCFIVS